MRGEAAHVNELLRRTLPRAMDIGRAAARLYCGPRTAHKE